MSRRQAIGDRRVHGTFTIIAYTIKMNYDLAKARTNLHKHAIDLPGCMAAFDAPMLTREDDRGHYAEQRFVSMGQAHGRVVVLIWTDREDGPRLISCRKATPYERQIYYRAYPKA